MRSRHLTFIGICLLSVYGYGCGGSSPSPDASDAPKDVPKDVAADGPGGSDGATDKGDAAVGDAPDLANPDSLKDGGGDGSGDVDVGGPPPCMVATDCPGMDSECQHRTCTAGICGTVYETVGKVLATQVIGDCKVRQCGANGAIASANDDKDIPDDINACTKDACAAGVASHTPVAKDTTCGGGKLCNATGQCVGCNTAADCPGTDSFCRMRTCVQSVCGVTFTAAGTKLVDAQSGDCKIQQCDGQGVIQTVAAPTDVPVDNNLCTQDQCNGTTPTHQPVARNTSCGNGQVCDGASHCVTCLTAATCPGTDGECQARTCVNGACGISFTASGTAVKGQITGDCKKRQCDGRGMIINANDNTDPLVDNNPCTKDQCDNGVASNPPVAARTNCGANLQCDGNGLCVTCLGVADCPGTDSECQVRTCIAGRCGVSFTAAGFAVASQVQGDCKVNQCDGKGAVVTVNDDTDTKNDNNACTSDVCSGGVGSHPNLPAKTACGNGLECDGNGKCVNCVQASECGTNAECITYTCTNGTCGSTLAVKGTPVADLIPKDCNKRQCDGSGNIETVPDGTDLPVDGLTCTNDVCMNGAASNPPVAARTMCMQNAGVMCNATGACVQCLNPADCGTDTSGCKMFTCTNGACGVINATAGSTPVGFTQVPGDCQSVVCDGSGARTSVADNTDKPVDGLVCTDDVCTNGAPSNPVVTDRSCNGTEFCRSDGACVQCNHDPQCGSMNDTFCLKHTCVNNGCTIASSPMAGTMTPNQHAGDCQDNVCDGSGNAINQPNPNDPPPSPPCVSVVCNGDTPVSTPLPAGTSCGNGMCNGAGRCDKCLKNSDCGADTECQTQICDTGTGTCSTQFKTPGFVLPSQTPGDCIQRQCDVNGNAADVADPNDLPDDSNKCTNDICTGTMPSHTNVTKGTDCTPSAPGSTKMVCNETGTCVGCNTAADCGTNSADGCKVFTCTAGMCGRGDPVSGTLSLTGQMDHDCKDLVCDGMGGTMPKPNVMDLPVDNKACTVDACDANGTPSNPNATAGTVCNEGGGRFCDGSGTCDANLFAVVRAGDGQSTLSNLATPVFVEIRSKTSGTVYKTVSIPTTDSGNNKGLVLSGTADSDGALALSGDGHFVTLGGYANTAAAGSPIIGNSTLRGIAKIDSNFNPDTSAQLPTVTNQPFSKNNIRSIVTNDGNEYWLGGQGSSSTGGVWFFKPSTNALTQISGAAANGPNNVRVCRIDSNIATNDTNPQLYCTSNTSAFRSVYPVGTDLPTTALTVPPVVVVPSGVSPFGFVFMHLVSTGPNPDTLYIADETAVSTPPPAAGNCASGSGGILKFSRAAAGGAWTCIGTMQPTQDLTNSGTQAPISLRHLFTDVSTSNNTTTVTIYATTIGSTTNAIIKCTGDTQTSLTATCTTLAASPTNTLFRGIAPAPSVP